MGRDYLLEIGCEEIPAAFIGPALWHGSQALAESLRKARLPFERVDISGTPRRLAFTVRGLAESQESGEETLLGPPRSVAFDAEGKPTKAAEGFARSLGVAVSELGLHRTEKGEYAGIVRKEAARPTAEVLPAILSDFIPSIPFRKSMRWADLDVRFARPVQWIVSLFGSELIPLEYGVVKASNVTSGHRFLAPAPIVLADVSEYAARLADAYVLVELEDRKSRIREGLRKLESETGKTWVEDEPLVETVANLVEWPVVMKGGFEDKYLRLLPDILVTTMRNNQKYFVFKEADGSLSSTFAFVSNMKVEDPRIIVAGNERVLRARLSDAEFYYDDDLKMPLFDRAQALKSVLFQKDLGMYWEKVERVAEVAAFVAVRAYPGREADCRRAAILSKSDLTTGVVKEFPELQGVMGAHYAEKTGEAPEIARAVLEHYLPKGQSDDLPSTDVGAAVAIADKIDMVCGCFGVGLIPTGTADPYALRRQTLGILSILEARGLRIPLADLVDASLATLAPKLKAPASEVRAKVLDFFSGRLLNLWTSRGAAGDLVEAVLSAGLSDVVDMRAKLDALSAFRGEAAFEPLAEVFKRAINITKGVPEGGAVDPSLFEHDEERQLHSAVAAVANGVADAARAGRYAEALSAMAGLQGAVAAFFDKVLVMAKDEKVKANRLALLSNLSRQFSSVADFSKVAVGKAN